MISSYVWNYDLCDLFAEHVKKVNKDAICILGGPHIGTNDFKFFKTRINYDFICQPTKPGEIFMEDLTFPVYTSRSQLLLLLLLPKKGRETQKNKL